MPFDFSSDISSLESHLADKSYISGYAPTQADVTVFSALKVVPDSKQYPHSARWYKHIKSHEVAFASLVGDKSLGLEAYGPPLASTSTSAAPKEVAKPDDDDDDEVDLFGSDDEEVDEEAEKLKQQRLAEYAAKKAGKAKPAAKSVVTLDVKPWDDETDMKALENSVRSIQMDGLVWGLSKLVPVGYGVSKLQINMVIEDEKVGLDDLQDLIAEFEDYVQSSDVQAMQKL